MNDIFDNDPRDRYVIVNRDTGHETESQRTLEGVVKAHKILNDHEERHGRQPVYVWVERKA